MNKTISLLLPLSLIAGSYDDLEKELFETESSSLESTDSFESKDVAYTPQSPKTPTPVTPQPRTQSQPMQTQKNISPKHDELPYTLEGEVLYLKPYLSNVPYLIDSNLTAFSQDAPQYVSSRIKNQKFEGDFGFNLNASFQTHWIDSILNLGWMRFYTKSKQKSYVISDFGDNGYNAPEALGYVWNANFTEPQLTSSDAVLDTLQSFTANASGTSKLNIDLITFMIKFPYLTKKRLTLLPSFGVQGFLFNYSSHIDRLKNYWGSGATDTSPFNKNLVYLKQRFNAIGPSLAFEGGFDLGSNWSFDFLAQAAAVFGQLKSYNNTKMITPDPLTADNQSKANMFKALANIRMGFSWNKQWSKVGLLVKAGYDVHFMPNVIQLVNSNSNSIWRSDLSTQGVYGGLGLEF
jgi:Legionella pneumophila major outer membrane protein precursor